MKRRYFLFLLVLLPAMHLPLRAAIHIQSLTPSVSSPQALGTTIVWRATATDTKPGPLTFQFDVISPSGASSMVVDFNVGTQSAGVWTSEPFAWTTIAGEGTYQVRVVAKDFGSGENQELSVSYSLSSRLNGGQAAVHPTQNPLVALFSAPSCPLGGTMQVTFRRSGGPVGTGTDWKPCTGTTSMNFYVAGMYPSATYDMTYRVQIGPTITPGPNTLSFTTGALPLSIKFPPFVPVVAPGSEADRSQPVIVHSVGVTPHQPYGSPVATDLAGNILWYYHQQQRLLLTRPLGETMLGIQNGPAWNTFTNLQQHIIEVDLAGNVVHDTNTGVIQQQLLAMGATEAGPCSAIPNPPPIGAACLTTFNHEVMRLPNGYTAVLASSEKIFPPGTQGSTSSLPVDILGDFVIVLDTNWQAVWYWDSFNPLGGGKGYAKLPVSRRATMNESCKSLAPSCPPLFLLSSNTAPAANEWLHANSIYYMPSSGDFLVSLRDQDWLIKIDYNNGTGTGNVLWRMGREGDFTFNNVNNDPWPWFSGQHDAGYENNGAGPLTVFDDGNSRVAPPPLGLGSTCGPNDCNSRGMALMVDETPTQMTVTPVLNQDLGKFSTMLGSAQLLNNGSYFFDAGHVQGVNSYSVEIMPTAGTVNGTIVYELRGPIVYRNFRMSDLYHPPTT